MDSLVFCIFAAVVIGLFVFSLDVVDKTVTVGEFDAGYHIVKSLTGGN